MSHVQDPLPYAKDALVPHFSAETFEYHYGKHHLNYVNKLNELIAGTEFAELDLVATIRKSKGTNGKVFNNAAQHFNHAFYWKCLSPKGGGLPTGALAAAIERDFGGFDKFKAAFEAAATLHFGSGWAWLVKDADGKLKIVDTHDADSPVATPGLTPLLTADVWEHAYYIDYRNARPKYLEAFWKVVDWGFVSSQL